MKGFTLIARIDGNIGNQLQFLFPIQLEPGVYHRRWPPILDMVRDHAGGQYSTCHACSECWEWEEEVTCLWIFFYKDNVDFKSLHISLGSLMFKRLEKRKET